ncbi:MAG: hypothetical protein QM811_08030 [Pirellulales bacterium]
MSRFLPVVILLALVILGIWAWSTQERPGGDPAVAAELQRSGEYAAAADAWAKVVSATPPEHEMYGAYVLNERICRTRAAERAADDATAKSPPRHEPKPTQAKVPEKDLLEFYAVGRTVLSTGYFEVHGKGTNVAWGFKTQANFASKHRVLSVSNVTRNDGRTMVVEQDFKLVTQEVEARDDGTIELAWPTNPLLNTITDTALLIASKSHPELIVVKKAVQFYEKFDPNYKKALTGFAKAVGADFEPNEHRKFIGAVKALQGAKLRYTYVNGIGVMPIEDLSETHALSKPELNRLAARAGLLTDYLILEVEKLKTRKTYSVEDVAQMVTLPSHFDIHGEITFEKSTAAQDPSSSVKGERLTVTSGPIEVSALVEGIVRRARMIVAHGEAFVSPQDKLVTEARIEWESDLQWATEDDLLFKTTGQADLKFRSYYEVRVLKPGESAPAP